MTVRVAASPAIGSLTGVLLAEHHGLPLWAFAGLMSVSLLFGVLATMGREGRRRVTPRQAVFNSGALWVLAFSATMGLDLSLSLAAVLSLAIGLLGPEALAVTERVGGGALEWLLRRLVDPSLLPVTHGELEQTIGEVRNQTQAAVAEQALARRKEEGDDGST